MGNPPRPAYGGTRSDAARFGIYRHESTENRRRRRCCRYRHRRGAADRRHPLGFPDLGDPGPGRARNRVSADDRGLDQDRAVAVAEREVNDVTLEAPKDRDASNRVKVGSVQADMTLKSVWSGHPQITELVITRPVLHHPLLRERERLPAPAAGPAASSDGTDANALAIDRVTIVDGTMVMFNLRDRVENRIEGINAEALIGDDRKIKVTGRARAGEHPLKFAIAATVPAPPLQRQNIPVELTLDASGLLQAPLAAKAEVRLNGSIVMINGVTGTLGDGAFNGWASVDLSSKPLVKLDLDFQRLEVATSKERATSASLGSQPWSNASIDLSGLNYVDAQLRVSAAELNIGEARFAPVAIDTAVAAGVLKTSFSNLGVYGGQASGQLIIDVTSGSPGYAFSSDLVGVRALPLLRSAADFDKL